MSISREWNSECSYNVPLPTIHCYTHMMIETDKDTLASTSYSVSAERTNTTTEFGDDSTRKIHHSDCGISAESTIQTFGVCKMKHGVKKIQKLFFKALCQYFISPLLSWGMLIAGKLSVCAKWNTVWRNYSSCFSKHYINTSYHLYLTQSMLIASKKQQQQQIKYRLSSRSYLQTSGALRSSKAGKNSEHKSQ